MRNTFMIGSQVRVDTLTQLLHEEILPRFGMRLGNRGAFRAPLEERDVAEYALMQGESEVGKYEFELRNRVYHCAIQNDRIPAELYGALVENLGTLFPEVKQLSE